jgi:hypothetical protein
MKKITVLFAVMFIQYAVSLYGQETKQAPTQAVTVQDYDKQIAQLKEDIARYEGLASVYQQQAQLVEFRDFSGYQDATNLQNRCLAIAADLKEHLKVLEQQKAALTNASSQKK